MTKILNIGLKIRGVVGRVAHAKSSDPATPPKFEMCTGCLFRPNFLKRVVIEIQKMEHPRQKFSKHPRGSSSFHTVLRNFP